MMPEGARPLCNAVSVSKGPCVLTLGHAGMHVWEHADRELTATAQKVRDSLKRMGADSK